MDDEHEHTSFIIFAQLTLSAKFATLNFCILEHNFALECTEQVALLNARFYPILVLLLIEVDDVDKRNDFSLSNILIVCMKNIPTV